MLSILRFKTSLITVSISQQTSAYVSIRQHTSVSSYVSIHQHTSAYVRLRQHTSAYLDHCLARVPRLLLQLPSASCRTPPRPEHDPPPAHQQWAEEDPRVARYRAISLYLSLSHPLPLSRSLAGARALAVRDVSLPRARALALSLSLSRRCRPP